ncbi:hypothetical protein HYQ46_008480 [Verticillium longisporum]|nr:hypothetical protein HYQ46_008480 [Verticillium longisporum]
MSTQDELPPAIPCGLSRYQRKKYTSPWATKTCSIVYSSRGTWTSATVRSSASRHMAATSGMPRFVVLAAPQKQMATV